MTSPSRVSACRAAASLGAGLLAALGATALSVRLAGWRSPLGAVVLHATLMRWAADALPALRPPLRGGWYRVRAWEAPLYRRLGAPAYRLLLRRVGWEAYRRGAVGFTGRRASLARLERATREAETNHLLLGLLGLGLAGLALRRRAWRAALWQVLLTAGLHAYPVMLQRSLRARLQPLPVGSSWAGPRPPPAA